MNAAAETADAVTVVVLTYNRRQELERCLHRLTALPENPPIIVVDNGSSDDTVQFVRRRHPQVRLVQSPSNKGAAGRNLGVEQVTTPFVAFSDDDTWWAPGSLKRAAAILQNNPKLAVLSARILVEPDQRLDPACNIMQASPLPEVEGVGPMLTGFMAGANIMRTEAFRQCGGYWPPFFIGGEEALLAMDILEAGWRIAYAPALLVHHRPSLNRDSTLRRRLVARNAIWTACLRLPWPVAARRIRDVLSQLDGAERGQVLAATARHMPRLLRARQVVGLTTLTMLQAVWKAEIAAC